MASEGSVDDKSRVVARVASKLFAVAIPESNVIVETLERVTDSGANAASVQSLLGAAVDKPIPTDVSDQILRTAVVLMKESPQRAGVRPL